MKNQQKGTICLLSATAIWGFAFIAQSVGMEKLEPFTFQAVRCALAVLFLIPTAFCLEGKTLGFRESCRRWLHPKLWLSGLICGGALFVAASLQQIGLLYTDAGKAGFLTAMYIVLVPVLGLFLGKVPGKRVWFSVALAVAGMYLLSCTGVEGINRGDLCLMGCALAFAVQITCIDRYAKDLDGVRLNCIQSLVVTVLSLPFLFAMESPSAGDILDCWWPLLFAGVMSMGVAYTLQIQGQKYLNPSAASLLMSLESVFAALGGWLVLGERMNGAEILGCGLMFAAVLISQKPEPQKAETPKAA